MVEEAGEVEVELAEPTVEIRRDLDLHPPPPLRDRWYLAHGCADLDDERREERGGAHGGKSIGVDRFRVGVLLAAPLPCRVRTALKSSAPRSGN